MDEIIDDFEFEQLMKDITLGGTEFRSNAVKHKRNKERDEIEATQSNERELLY